MQDKIKTIFDYHNLGQIKEIKELKGGFINKVFLVNNEYVIKFSSKRKEFYKEDYILRNFSSLPIANYVIYDNSSEIVPEEYIIETKLEGENLGALWPSLTEIQKEQIFEEYILTLKKFHSYNFDFYGSVVLDGEHFDKWSSCFNQRYNHACNLARQTDLMSADLFKLIDSYYYANKQYLDKCSKPSFCHNDLHFGNILVSGEKITGILDFDLSNAAPIDAEFDIPICFFKQPSFFMINEVKMHYKKPLENCSK